MPAIDLGVVAFTIAIYAAIVVSPGPSFALVSRLALRGEMRRCRGAIAGIATAATFYAVLAMLGLAAVLNELGWLARTVQVIGGLYLVYLGLRAWFPGHEDVARPLLRSTICVNHADFRSGLRLGILINLSNPKGIAFFVGLYAAAVPPDATLSTRLAVLLGGLVLELGWYNVVARTLSIEKLRLAYQAWSKWIERCLGAVLVFFGLRMILNR